MTIAHEYNLSTVGLEDVGRGNQDVMVVIPMAWEGKLTCFITEDEVSTSREAKVLKCC
jgi:hypothetical protein